MIGKLTGIIEPIGLDQIIVDVGGVGYLVHVPTGMAGRLGKDGQTATLNIYTAVREDAIQLFGFSNQTERFVFTKLITVSGIGPKTALAVLSDLDVDQITGALQSEDIAMFTKVSGIGKKTAQRVILELKNAFDQLAVTSSTSSPKTSSTPMLDDVRSALQNLGYKPSSVDEVIDKLEPIAQDGQSGATTESLLRQALKWLN